jgi:pimeloyl-ACP methyl ester carboxylesterase
MRLGAEHVDSVIIPDCGHYPAEEAPEELLAALTGFLPLPRRASPPG